MPVSSDSLPSFFDLVKFLFFTHNTLLSVLYTMVTTPDAHHIRCCKPDGAVMNRGAQFRHGLDSQYGDVVFVMKRDFWLELKGVDYHKKEIINNTFVGHFYKRDFIPYDSEANKFHVERWLETDSRMYDFRPATVGLNGKECKLRTWNVSWCNVQLHIGDNVGFEHVYKVYVPAWVVQDSETMSKIEGNGVNTTLLRQLVTNQLPFYPGEEQVANPLNGLFALYGPAQASEHYYLIEKERGKFKEKTHSDSIYQPIEPASAEEPAVQTHRHASSSSAISLHEKAFLDLQIRYMMDLVRHNLTELPPKEGVNLRKFLPYKVQR